MKKVIIFYFLISAVLFSASVSGNVTVYTGEDYGVFVYVKGASGYDITDSKGNFKVIGVQKGKEYKVVFQKDNFPDVIKTLKISEENTVLNVEFKKKSAFVTEESVKKTNGKTKVKKKKSEVKYKNSVTREITGKIVTASKESVFIKVKGKIYGNIVNSNSKFVFKTDKDALKIEIYQPGMKEKDIAIAAGNKRVNIGEIRLEVEKKESFDYKVNFNKKIDGVVYLYSNDKERYSVRVEQSDTAVFKNIEPGNYTFKVVSYGNEDYKNTVIAEDGKQEKIEVENSISKKRVYIYTYPEKKEINLKLYKNDEFIKNINGVKGLYIAENMEEGSSYKIVAECPKYMTQEARAVKAGERVNITLERDIRGAVVSGTIYPFGVNAEIMLLDGENILGIGKSDENGNYEIEVENIKSGRKTVRVRADGFKEAIEIRTINEKKENENVNIALTPLASDIFGIIKVPNQKDSSGVYVAIEELNIWQLTDADGKYYFSGVPEGKYTVSFRKYGYKEIKKEMNFSKKSTKEVNTEMQAIGKIVINSNITDYKLKINENQENVNKKVYVSEQPVGEIYITASKDGYLNENIKTEISEPGELKELNITFRNSEEYKKYLEDKIAEISQLIDGLFVAQAERKIEEFKLLEGSDGYSGEIEKLTRKLNQAKGNLFDDDRKILSEISRVRKEIELIEKENIGYGEKRKKLGEKYRETLDFIEKILSENKYTTFKYDIYMFRAEIYEKSGMPNSSKESKVIAMKYMEEQKKKR